MRRFIGIGALLGLVLTVYTGCTTTGTTVGNPADFYEVQKKESVQVKQLVSGDTIELSIEVDGRMEVSLHQAKINHLGNATLPLVGDVRVGGLVLNQARDVIAKKYGAYYVNPPVIMLSLAERGTAEEWGHITVLGRVNQPGRIPLKSQAGMKLSEAVQTSGGFSTGAKQKDVRVTRIDGNGKKRRISIDFEQIGQAGNADADLTLIDGDIIYVPERIF